MTKYNLANNVNKTPLYPHQNDGITEDVISLFLIVVAISMHRRYLCN